MRACEFPLHPAPMEVAVAWLAARDPGGPPDEELLADLEEVWSRLRWRALDAADVAKACADCPQHLRNACLARLPDRGGDLHPSGFYTVRADAGVWEASVTRELDFAAWSAGPDGTYRGLRVANRGTDAELVPGSARELLLVRAAIPPSAEVRGVGGGDSDRAQEARYFVEVFEGR